MLWIDHWILLVMHFKAILCNAMCIISGVQQCYIHAALQFCDNKMHITQNKASVKTPNITNDPILRNEWGLCVNW